MILVTGGAGYFAESVIRNLMARGERVRTLDISRLEGYSDVEHIQGDIRDYTICKKACEGVSVVHHNVAQVPLAKNPQLFDSVNRQGTQNLLRAALETKVHKVIYTSSSAVFGIPKTNPVTELTKPSPMEAYGQAKYDGELVCQNFIEKGLDVSIIRPRTILGHGRLGIFQVLFEWIRQGGNIPVLGKGDNVYQFVHTDDLAEACVLAGFKSGPDIFNIGATEYGTMRETLEALCAHAGSGSRVRSLPRIPIELMMSLFSKLNLSPLGTYHKLMYGRSMYFDTSKAEVKLNWSAKYSNIKMIAESYDWYIKNREIIANSSEHSPHKRAVKEGVLSMVRYVL